LNQHDHDEDKRTDASDPAMPGAANPSSHEPTSEPDAATGYRRHTGAGGAPGPPGNAPASPLDATPVVYDGEDAEDE
jgi:hypothetical protein